MKTRSTFFLLIALIAFAQFFLSNELFRGYLRSEVYLAKELKSPAESIYEYRISDEAPFRYRILFSSLVEKSYEAVYDDDDAMGFFYTYRFWSAVFYVLSACSFFWLMLQCGFSLNNGLAGALIYLLLPPMILAYTLPIHTREDMLAYTLFFTGLGLLIRGDRWLFLSVAVLGVLTRETLMLLPLLYFFFGRDERLRRRLLIATIPCAIWLTLRFVMGHEPYDMWLGFRWNLDNPAQVIGFSFITFSFLWLSFFLHFIFFKRNTHFINSDLRFFYRSSLFVFVIVFVTTFLFGIFNEIRLLNLFAPWMVVFFLDSYRNYGDQIRQAHGTKNYRIYAAGVFIFCAGLLYLVLENRERLITPGKFSVPYDQWVVFSVCYIFVVLLLIPHLLTIFSLKKYLK